VAITSDDSQASGRSGHRAALHELLGRIITTYADAAGSSSRAAVR